MRQPGPRYKPWIAPQVAELRGRQKMTYRAIGEIMGLSGNRIRQIWLRHLHKEGRKCLGCNPEPLEGMTVPMRWLV